MSSKIQIGIPCGINSEHYAKHLIWSSNMTVSDQKRVEFILAINDQSVDVNEILSVKTDSEIVVLNAINSHSASSMGHGICLDVILDYMSERCGMIVDSDVAFLSRDWDKNLLSFISGKCVIVGSEYDGEKYLNFPNAIACLFDVNILKSCNVSFLPAKTRRLMIDDTNSEIFGRSPGETIDLDVGWELPLKIKNSGYTGVSLPLIRSKDCRSKFMSVPGMRGEEHQINGEPIFTHLGRSLSRDFHKDFAAVTWRNRVEEWILNYV